MAHDRISFSFGENWQDFLKTVGDEDIAKAKADIEEWLGKDYVRGKSVLDIGSGSGIQSLAFHQLGAKSLYSFDYDPHSVEATMIMRDRAGNPRSWTVSQGSVLDKKFLESLGGGFDVVYAWGVLHHTGHMWEAVGNSMSLVNPCGKLWISLYAKGPRYPRDLAMKRKFNAASRLGKKAMIYRKIGRRMLGRIVRLRNPFSWNEKWGRGMNVYHDIVDWLGGLPYETASEDEVLAFCIKGGLEPDRKKIMPEGACSIFVFNKPNLGKGQV